MSLPQRQNIHDF